MAPCRSAGRQDHRIDGSFVRDRRAGKLVRIRRSGFNGPLSGGATLMSGFLMSGVLTSLLLVGAARPVLAETRESQVTSPLGTVSLTMQSPQRFTEAKCLFIPLDVEWQRRADVTVVGELTVRKPGTSIANADSFLLAPNEPVAGNYTDYVYVCPADGPGAYVVSGTVSFIGADSSDVVAMSPMAFTVVPASTSVTGLMLSQSGSKVTVSGRAVITSNGNEENSTSGTPVRGERLEGNRERSRCDHLERECRWWNSPHFRPRARHDRVVERRRSRRESSRGFFREHCSTVGAGNARPCAGAQVQVVHRSKGVCAGQVMYAASATHVRGYTPVPRPSPRARHEQERSWNRCTSSP